MSSSAMVADSRCLRFAIAAIALVGACEGAAHPRDSAADFGHPLVDTTRFVGTAVDLFARQLLTADSTARGAEGELRYLRSYRSEREPWDRHLRDAFGTPFRVTLQVDSLIVSSAGPDRVFDTDDDISARRSRRLAAP